MKAGLLLAVALLATGAALADPMASAETFLSDRHFRVQPERWALLGSEAAPVLRRIAADGSRPGWMRLRAVVTLSLFHDPDTLDALVGYAHHPSDVVQRAALDALAQASPARARPVLEEALASPHETVRAVAYRRCSLLSPLRVRAAAAAEPVATLRESAAACLKTR